MHVEEADPDGPLFSAICGFLCIFAPVFPVIDAAFAFVYRCGSYLFVTRRFAMISFAIPIAWVDNGALTAVSAPPY